MSEHFNQVVEMVKLGSGTFREVDNFHLSRMACLIIAENADGKKPQVQAARIYFKEQTSISELVENQTTSRILIYKTNQGETRVDVLFNGKTFWLTQKRMADLYDVDVSTVNYHLGNIFETGELKEEATIRKIPIVQLEGNREVSRPQLMYNLDAIIAKEKAYEEYDKFRLIQDREYLSDFDKEVRNWKPSRNTSAISCPPLSMRRTWTSSAQIF